MLTGEENLEGYKFLLIHNNEIIDEQPSIKLITSNCMVPLPEGSKIHKIKTSNVFSHEEVCLLSGMVGERIFSLSNEAILNKRKDKILYQKIKKEQLKWVKIKKELRSLI